MLKKKTVERATFQAEPRLVRVLMRDGDEKSVDSLRAATLVKAGLASLISDTPDPRTAEKKMPEAKRAVKTTAKGKIRS